MIYIHIICLSLIYDKLACSTPSYTSVSGILALCSQLQSPWMASSMEPARHFLTTSGLVHLQPSLPLWQGLHHPPKYKSNVLAQPNSMHLFAYFTATGQVTTICHFLRMSTRMGQPTTQWDGQNFVTDMDRTDMGVRTVELLPNLVNRSPLNHCASWSWRDGPILWQQPTVGIHASSTGWASEP